MKFNVALTLLVALALVVSCNSSTENSSAISSPEEIPVEDTRGVDLGEDIAEEEDINLLFSKKWKSDGAMVDLKIDGSFKAKFGEDDPIHGTWSLQDDGRTLQLTGDQAAEGKGANFNQKYEVLDVNDATMRVKDSEGKEWTFSAE